MPADSRVFNAPDRRGKVVIVGQRSWDKLATGPWRDPFLGNYAEPIASRTSYPTMICPVPGEYDGSGDEEISIGFLRELRLKTEDPIDHPYFRLAIPYLRALDVMADILKVEKEEIRAVIGGHSKSHMMPFLRCLQSKIDCLLMIWKVIRNSLTAGNKGREAFNRKTIFTIQRKFEHIKGD